MATTPPTPLPDVAPDGLGAAYDVACALAALATVPNAVAGGPAAVLVPGRIETLLRSGSECRSGEAHPHLRWILHPLGFEALDNEAAGAVQGCLLLSFLVLSLHFLIAVADWLCRCCRQRRSFWEAMAEVRFPNFSLAFCTWFIPGLCAAAAHLVIHVKTNPQAFVGAVGSCWVFLLLSLMWLMALWAPQECTFKVPRAESCRLGFDGHWGDRRGYLRRWGFAFWAMRADRNFINRAGWSSVELWFQVVLAIVSGLRGPRILCVASGAASCVMLAVHCAAFPLLRPMRSPAMGALLAAVGLLNAVTAAFIAAHHNTDSDDHWTRRAAAVLATTAQLLMALGGAVGLVHFLIGACRGPGSPEEQGSDPGGAQCVECPANERSAKDPLLGPGPDCRRRSSGSAVRELYSPPPTMESTPTPPPCSPPMDLATPELATSQSLRRSGHWRKQSTLRTRSQLHKQRAHVQVPEGDDGGDTTDTTQSRASPRGLSRFQTVAQSSQNEEGGLLDLELSHIGEDDAGPILSEGGMASSQLAGRRSPGLRRGSGPLARRSPSAAPLQLRRGGSRMGSSLRQRSAPNLASPGAAPLQRPAAESADEKPRQRGSGPRRRTPSFASQAVPLVSAQDASSSPQQPATQRTSKKKKPRAATTLARVSSPKLESAAQPAAPLEPPSTGRTEDGGDGFPRTTTVAMGLGAPADSESDTEDSPLQLTRSPSSQQRLIRSPSSQQQRLVRSPSSQQHRPQPQRRVLRSPSSQLGRPRVGSGARTPFGTRSQSMQQSPRAAARAQADDPFGLSGRSGTTPEEWDTAAPQAAVRRRAGATPRASSTMGPPRRSTVRARSGSRKSNAGSDAGSATSERALV
eukprot:TRINITY_DN23592_c0_g1_i1.p1 TRINITY_DN23592_c0_g1~~TRINITY_DN23592_c0_g1_i1.p1  ORF type:complete len:859 (+),score=145.98 TRINITY_DN23592_c0_g1_i1:154-2730(+)